MSQQSSDLPIGRNERTSLSTAFVVNADQWPNFNGYKSLRSQAGCKEIRLLDLSYDLHARRIRCALIHHDLGDDQLGKRYYALSYYWGASGMEREIEIDGVTVFVRKNVYDFLKALSRSFGRIHVWLDVLCINQRDTAERNQQVTLMHEIFSAAEAVYSWLGKGDADSTMLLDLLENFSEKQSEILTPASHYTAIQLVSYAERLLAHPYFTRVWTVQECVLAKRLYLICGSEVIEGSLFLKGVQKITSLEKHMKQKQPKSNDRYGGQLRQAKNMLRVQAKALSRQGSDLLDVMDEFSLAKCVDPRDKVFGFRALSREMDVI